MIFGSDRKKTAEFRRSAAKDHVCIFHKSKLAHRHEDGKNMSPLRNYKLKTVQTTF